MLNCRSFVCWKKIAILIAIFFQTSFVATAQSISEGLGNEAGQSATSWQADKYENLNFPLLETPPKSQPQEAPYHPITPRQSLQWFITNTIGPQTLAGGFFESVFGTALDRPSEYGPHWGGFADRYGMGMTRVATGNAIEAGVGLILREDPHYFRVPDRPLKARIGNVVRLAFAARGGNKKFRPASARTVAIFGNNFLSDTWRAHSEANAQDALLRTSEGFAGRMAANAFEEFWPDVKRLVFRKHNNSLALSGKSHN